MSLPEKQSSLIKQKTAILESVFEQIQKQRMVDIPIVNNKIEIQAVGFRHWRSSYLGIMITPWFMNLMLLPGESEDWDEQQELSASTHRFPSGNYEFLVGFEAGIGTYQQCSLFSPMFEFANHQAAVETAEAAMLELMNDENIETVEINSAEIEDIWNGIESKPHAAENGNQVDTRSSLSKKAAKPISRRKLLRSTLQLDKGSIE